MARANGLEEKHGAKSRRGWRKLRLAVDGDGGEIIAHSLRDQETGDALQLELLLGQIDDEIDQLTADGAYDGYRWLEWLACVYF